MNQLNTYANTIAAMQAQQNWQQQFDTSNSQWQQQFDTANKQWQMQWDRQSVLDQISRDDISYDRKLFAAQYLYETTGDASGLKMLGYTDSQIAALRNSYAQAMAQRSTYSSGGGGGGTEKDVRFDEGNNKYKVSALGPTANRQNITTYEQLSPAAQNAANNLAKSYADNETKGQYILGLESNGSITEQEAMFLIGLLGQ